MDGLKEYLRLVAMWVAFKLFLLWLRYTNSKAYAVMKLLY